MFMVRLIDDENVILKVYDTLPQGDNVFFLTWDSDRGWHYINSNLYLPLN